MSIQKGEKNFNKIRDENKRYDLEERITLFAERVREFFPKAA